MIEHQHPAQSIFLKIISIAPPLVILVILVWINYPVFGSWFGIIDDHMYISQLMPGNELKLWQIPRELFNTELANFGSTPRYRPTYWLIQFVQTSLFGDSATARYVYRSILQFASSLLIFKICLLPLSRTSITRPSLMIDNRIVATLIAISFTSLLSWGDITHRLGPSEADLVFGICLSMFATFRIVSETSAEADLFMQRFNYLCIGILIASGSKENGVISYMLLLYVTIFYLRKEPRPSLSNKLALFLTSTLVFAVTMNSLLVIKSGADLYANPLFGSHLISTLLTHLKSWNFLLLTMTLCLMYIIFKFKPSPSKKAHLLLTVFLFLLNISESIFYRGSFEQMRYAILTQLSYLVSFGLVAINLITIAYEKLNKRDINYRILIATFVLAILFQWTPIRNIQILNKSALEKSESTLAWKVELDDLAKSIGKNPDYQIVISHNNTLNDYERIYSTIQFLRFRNVKNQVFVKINSLSNADSELTKQLLESLTSMSQLGSANWQVSPKSNLKPSKYIYCISFGRDFENKQMPINSNIIATCQQTKVITS